MAGSLYTVCCLASTSVMIEPVLLLGGCLLLGLLCLATVVWIVATGRIVHLDGLSLALISLGVGGIFLSVFGWSLHTGELKEILKSRSKERARSEKEGTEGD